MASAHLVACRLVGASSQEDDGSLWEDWLDHHMVRPMPPVEYDAGFANSLKKGAALEIFIEEGWWEVEFVSRDGNSFTVESKRYKVQHVVQRTNLRPAWRWDEKSRTWGTHDRLPNPKEKGAPPRAAPGSKSKKGKA